MATDATGTPTSLGIPKFDTSNDAPSGLGFNAAMDAINTLLGNYVAKSLVTAAGDLIYATGNAAVARLPIGSAAQVLTVSGGIPAWAAPGSGTPSGAAGGGLAGTYPNPTIAANAVASAQIVDGSIAVADLAAAVMQSKRIESGSRTGISIAGQSQTDTAITFGTAFGSAPVVICTALLTGGDANWGSGSQIPVVSSSTTGFTARCIQTPNSAVTAAAFSWIAIGA